MTREQIEIKATEYGIDSSAWNLIEEILADIESPSCENCQDYVNNTCTDSKGHYCIRNTSMEDRYVPKFERKDNG